MLEEASVVGKGFEGVMVLDNVLVNVGLPVLDNGLPIPTLNLASYKAFRSILRVFFNLGNVRFSPNPTRFTLSTLSDIPTTKAFRPF